MEKATTYYAHCIHVHTHAVYDETIIQITPAKLFSLMLYTYIFCTKGLISPRKAGYRKAGGKRKGLL